jgi:hypothetical protein
MALLRLSARAAQPRACVVDVAEDDRECALEFRSRAELDELGARADQSQRNIERAQQPDRQRLSRLTLSW